jgi:hypothetical protein
MERAARVFRNSEKSRSLLTDDQSLQAVWPVAVGEAIAKHTSRVRLVRTTLVVDAEDMIWQRQLRSLEKQVINRIQRLMPDIRIDGIEFRLALRRDPQTAASINETAAQKASVNAESEDEADRIQDPVLRKVYQISRRKASA